MQHPYPIFYRILANTFAATIVTNFIWFALTFWVILETRSVLAASLIAGIFTVTNMIGAVFFGGLVDHHKKKTAMLFSSFGTLIAYVIGTVLYFSLPSETLAQADSPLFWTLVCILMVGTVLGNLRMIALSTSVTILFANNRDKANGLVGATQGLGFAITSVISGLVIGFFGIGTALCSAIAVLLIVLAHLVFSIHIPEPDTNTPHDAPKRLDLRGTIAIIVGIPGLLALIFFHTFNNFLGGVFMALMDIYGLSLVSVKTWGIVLGVMSFAMIAGGTIVAKWGVGERPLRTIMIVNLISWATCIVFPIQPSIVLLAFGMFMWMLLFPIAEAAEQTVIQNIVPLERQGRVFGFSQSVESAATPITTFLIGPLTHFVFIPFMTTGAGVSLIGDWFGTGESRGIALVFIAAGMLGVILTTISWNSAPYRRLSNHYRKQRTP